MAVLGHSRYDDVKASASSSLRDAIADRLRDRIVSGELLPGDRLREEDLAQNHGVSRLSVREAISGLQSEGFVTVTKFRGASVAIPTAAAGLELLRVRQVLEALAAELAAQQISATDLATLKATLAAGLAAVDREAYAELPELVERFHDQVARASGNVELAAMLAQVRYKMRWVFRANLPRRGAECWHEHEEVLAAIEAGFSGLARELMDRHVAADATTLAPALPGCGQPRSGDLPT